jgi:hypothetical protein
VIYRERPDDIVAGAAVVPSAVVRWTVKELGGLRRLHMIAAAGAMIGVAAVASVGASDGEIPGFLRWLAPAVLIAIFLWAGISSMGARSSLELLGRRLILQAASRRITVDVDRARMTLAPWRPQPGMTIGSLLRLEDGGEVLEIGGQDRTFDPSSYGREPVRQAPRWVDGATFDAILAAVGASAAVHGGAAPAVTPRDGSRAELEIVRGAVAWHVIAAVMASMLGGAALAIATKLLGAPDSIAKLPAILGVVGAGIAPAILYLRGRRPWAVLRVDPAQIELRRPGRPPVAIPRESVRLRRWRHVQHSRYVGRMEVPVIEIEAPGHPPLTIGGNDPRLTWRGSLPEGRAPLTLVGGPDFIALVQALGRSDELAGIPSA